MNCLANPNREGFLEGEGDKVKDSFGIPMSEKRNALLFRGSRGRKSENPKGGKSYSTARAGEKAKPRELWLLRRVMEMLAGACDQ